VLPPEGSMVDWDDMYDFAALPKSKIAEIALVCPTLWQPPPVNHLKFRIMHEPKISFMIKKKKY
jgi:hypothetical protein